MSSRPVLALILEGDDVIQGVRDLLGPTDSNAAPAGTIRGDLGTDRMRNVVHASDGDESATAEITRFFKSEEILFNSNPGYYPSILESKQTAWAAIPSSLPSDPIFS